MLNVQSPSGPTSLGENGANVENHTIPTPFAFSIDVSMYHSRIDNSELNFSTKKLSTSELFFRTEWIRGFQHHPEIIQATTPHGSFKESGSTGASAYSERKDFKTRNIDLGVSKNMGKPQIIHFYRVFHEINHPFWGTIILGNTHFYPALAINLWVKQFYLTDFVLEGIQLTSTQNTGVQQNDSAEGIKHWYY